MYLRLETYNFGLETAREHRTGKLTSVKRKVILALLKSDLENQKKLGKTFWNDWDGKGEVVKLRTIETGDYKMKLLARLKEIAKQL